MRCAAKAAQKAVVRIRSTGSVNKPTDTADASASAATSARAEAARADVVQSKRSTRSPGSPVAVELEPSKEKALPSRPNKAWYHEIFGSDDDYADSSPTSARAHSQERGDRDGSHHRDFKERGINASVDTNVVKCFFECCGPQGHAPGKGDRRERGPRRLSDR